MWIHKLTGNAALGTALTMACHAATAQPSLPPLPTGAVPTPTRNVDAEARHRTERYGLSSNQAVKVRAVLHEQTKRLEEVANQYLPPPEWLDRLKSIRDEESLRVSAVLTSEQRKKYEQDARSALSAAPPSGFAAAPTLGAQ